MGEFGERNRDAQRGRGVDGEFVVSASKVLAGGLSVALAVALAATVPLRRITSLENARFE